MSKQESLEERLRALLAEAREAGSEPLVRSLLEEFLARKQESADQEAFPGRFGIIGDSAPMRAVFDLIERVAPSDVPVLIHGETGTGKELVAQALHTASNRSSKSFLAENCAAVPANLLESELFGHKRGSFTGAVADRAGHFVVADGGTIFLDEIGDMPLEMQTKLLRVLESGELRPVGGNKTMHVDVRVVGATNKDLEQMVEEGTFRGDLFYRLNVIRIQLPPLRDRGGDVELLTRFFLAKNPDGPSEISAEAMEDLRGRSWPGNVRQLENEVRRAQVLARGQIEVGDLTPRERGTPLG